MPCNSVAVQTAQLQYVLTLEQATQVLRGLGFSCTGELVQLYKMHSGKRVPEKAIEALRTGVTVFYKEGGRLQITAGRGQYDLADQVTEEIEVAMRLYSQYLLAQAFASLGKQVGAIEEVGGGAIMLTVEV